MWRMSVLSKVRPRDSLMLHISNCSLQNMSLTSDELQYRERENMKLSKVRAERQRNIRLPSDFVKIILLFTKMNYKHFPTKSIISQILFFSPLTYGLYLGVCTRTKNTGNWDRDDARLRERGRCRQMGIHPLRTENWENDSISFFQTFVLCVSL